MEKITQLVMMFWLLGLHQSTSGAEVTEIANQLKTTLSRSEMTLRLPFRGISSVSVVSDTPGVNKTPFGSEFFASEGNERWMQTGRSETRTPRDPNTSKQLTPPQADSGEFLIAGVKTRNASVAVRNPRYIFSLESARSGNSWLLTAIGKPDEASVAAIERSLTTRLTESFQPANWIVVLDGRQELRKLFEVDGFKHLSTSEPISGGPVTVNFTRSCRERTDLVIECAYTFDPTNGWLPIEWVEKASSADYSRSLHVTQKVAMQKGKYEANTVMTVSSEKPEKATITRKAVHVVEEVTDIPESEFSTTAFGIPEPAEFAVQPTPASVRILILAAVCILLTIVFRLLARRQSSQPR